ncbi:MAG: HEPN domain-containing protein [Planctomycetaceae bacterium]|jgi:HEPN domain-containing protein|nr:HEPN domain-containing protein [Planctomycetaceae bacterium]
MKKLVNDWVFFAEKDIKNASIIIEEEDLTTIAAFHCQQAIEKYFKAYILENNKSLLKIHDLPKLYGIIKEIKDFEIDEDLLSSINETYIEDRYPGELGLLPGGMPSIEQAKIFLEFAKEIEKKIKKELNKNVL